MYISYKHVYAKYTYQKIHIKIRTTLTMIDSDPRNRSLGAKDLNIYRSSWHRVQRHPPREIMADSIHPICGLMINVI